MGNCFQRAADVHDSGLFYGEKVHKIYDVDQLNKEILESKKNGKKVLVNFSASWCAPCRTMAPFYADLSARHPLIIFLAIDVNELSDICSAWGVEATPTIFFLENGEKVQKHVGLDKEELEEKLAKFVY
ncbi:thioredoxin H4-1-like [Curcuma longa]|uniref:thioredoxin H4-1-like n=1 Tax=Curcuma longa TaxID=136217 RepID=UPI003D9DB768